MSHCLTPIKAFSLRPFRLNFGNTQAIEKLLAKFA